MIEEEFELEAIRAVAPMDGSPDQRRRASARADLTALIEAEAAVPRATPKTQPKRAFRVPVGRRSLGALTGFAAAAAAAVAVLGHGGAVQPASAVAAILDRAAKAESLVTPVHLRRGQVWYVEDMWTGFRAQNPKTCGNACYETGVMRWWVAPKHYSMHTYVLSRSRTLQRITRVPPNVPMTANPNSARWSGVGGGYDQLLHYRLMLTTPTDVTSLRWLMWHIPDEHWKGPLSHWEITQMIFGNIEGVLQQPRVPGRMMAGLYRLLATMPGAVLKGRTTDTLGRSALEIEYSVGLAPALRRRAHTELALLFDPRTYALLDVVTRTRSTTPKVLAGYYATSYVASGLVHRIGGLPGASASNR